MVSGLPEAVTRMPAVSQWAETHRTAAGLGSRRAASAQPRLNSLSWIAFIGDPCPTKRAGILPPLLLPDFDFIAVRIAHVGAGGAGGELAAAQERAAGALDDPHGGIDVLRTDEPEPEVLDAAGDAGGPGLRGRRG